MYSPLLVSLIYARILIPKIVHYDAFKEALRNDGLAALAHPQRIRDTATAKLFIQHCKLSSLTQNFICILNLIIAAGFIAYEDTTSVPSLVRSAQGKILELGPGPGNQLHRFIPSLVDIIYGVDPNPNYGDEIAAKIEKLDIRDKYKLIACGIEESDILIEEGITEGSMDTVLSIQVLCAVGDVKSVMRAVWKLLKPGGSFIFWEHEKNKDTVTAMAQGMC